MKQNTPFLRLARAAEIAWLALMLGATPVLAEVDLAGNWAARFRRTFWTVVRGRLWSNTGTSDQRGRPPASVGLRTRHLIGPGAAVFVLRAVLQVI